MSVSDFDQESFNSSSVKDGVVSKLGSYELLHFNSNHSSKTLKQHTESFSNLDDCFHANYNYESIRSRLVNQPNSNNNNKNFSSNHLWRMNSQR